MVELTVLEGEVVKLSRFSALLVYLVIYDVLYRCIGGYFAGGGGGVSNSNVGGGGGGSGYIGYCIENSFTIAGAIGTTISRTKSAGYDDISYPSGAEVGYGGSGSISAAILPESGGPGMISISTRY